MSDLKIDVQYNQLTNLEVYILLHNNKSYIKILQNVFGLHKLLIILSLSI